MTEKDSKNKYQSGKIYKICSNQGDKVYYGSTTNKLWSRFAQHKTHYKRWQAGKDKTKFAVYSLFDEYGLDNCKIVLVEDYPCDRKDQLFAREDYHIQKGGCVNKNDAVQHPEKVAEYKKQYAEDHKEHIQQYQKDYYQENQDKIKEKGAEYRANNKEAIKQRKKLLTACGCGRTVRKEDYKRHSRSQFHQEWLTKQE